MNKKDLDKQLLEVFEDQKFVGHWWILKLPAFGGLTANEQWDKDPQVVIDHVAKYSEE